MIRKATVIGLMSGTSLDGVDAALVDFWEAGGRVRHRLRHQLTIPMPADLKQALLSAMSAGSLADVAKLDMRVGELLAEAAKQVIAELQIPASDVDLIGSHGQTLWHLPGKASLQIGQSAVIAERTGITTISDFRPADVAAGGQGAPLVPYADQELYGEEGRLIALLNIGGIANLTLIDGRHGPAEARVAFDTGPGNMVIDGLCSRIWKEPFDKDGARAAKGRIHDGLLRELTGNPYFSKPAPKSTGREIFGDAFVCHVLSRGSALKVNPEDIMASVTALSAFTIGEAVGRLPERPEVVRVSGGGARNPVLLDFLRRTLAGVELTVLPDADAKEAIAFALLAYRAAHGLLNHVPAATGASHPVVLGKITPGRNFGRVLLASRNPGDTEARHPATGRFDELQARDITQIMAEDEYKVARAIELVTPQISKAVTIMTDQIRAGGRVFYIGAGTSGRLGVLDAAECPPTFSTSPELIQAIIAGGETALVKAVEGAEDDWKTGALELAHRRPQPTDVIVGLSASGGAQYVDGAMRLAHKMGCKTILVTCNSGQEREYVNLVIAPLVGPEVLAGSTRLKAGTATKLVLNMLSTGVMVRLGKVYGNLMVDVHVSNEKLRTRAERILKTTAGVEPHEVHGLLTQAGGSVKVAIAMRRLGLDAASAREALERAGGFLRAVVGD